MNRYIPINQYSSVHQYRSIYSKSWSTRAPFPLISEAAPFSWLVTAFSIAIAWKNGEVWKIGRGTQATIDHILESWTDTMLLSLQVANYIDSNGWSSCLCCIRYVFKIFQIDAFWLPSQHRDERGWTAGLRRRQRKQMQRRKASSHKRMRLKRCAPTASGWGNECQWFVKIVC